MQKIEIDRNKPLNPGDRIEMHFITSGMFWLIAAQIALIESCLESRKDFRILSHSLPETNRVIFVVEVLKTNPVIITAAVIAAVIIGVSGIGLLSWLILDKVYQIFESPAGQVALAGVGLGGIAVLVVAVLLLLRHYQD